MRCLGRKEGEEKCKSDSGPFDSEGTESSALFEVSSHLVSGLISPKASSAEFAGVVV